MKLKANEYRLSEFVLSTYETPHEETNTTDHGMMVQIESMTGDVFVVQTWTHYHNSDYCTELSRTKNVFLSFSEASAFYRDCERDTHAEG